MSKGKRRNKGFSKDKYDAIMAERAAKQKAAQESIEKHLDDSMWQIRQTIVSIFLLGNSMIEHIDKLKEEDHNMSALKAGKRNYIIKQKLKNTCKSFLLELEKTINSESKLFTDEYIEDLNQTQPIIDEIASEFY